jgi:hypothetical protein
MEPLDLHTSIDHIVTHLSQGAERVVTSAERAIPSALSFQIVYLEAARNMPARFVTKARAVVI